MSISNQRGDREHAKFVAVDVDGSDVPAIRITNPDGTLIGEVGISEDVEGGSVTVGTSEVEITFTGTTESILIQADQSNTDYIYIGKTGVATDGTGVIAKLDAGDVLELAYDDSDNALFAISASAGQTIYKAGLI
jgi:hypothetical protein